MIKEKVTRWMKEHKLIADHESNHECDDVFMRAIENNDYTEWDAYIENVQNSSGSRISWWWDKPAPYHGWWKPFSVSSDEYNRNVILLGFNWTGQIAVALDRSTLYVDNDGTMFLNIPTKYWNTVIYDFEDTDGVKYWYNDHNELFCVEIGKH